ncbi:unnamed protein product [Linum tenue]|uniref:Uncharacterized protein n=1 Tax=Linum tenue TaxID=586396 RepID=A0AAV0L4V2_9ROSI|nr:unnamed protein product [Linum tenue]
MNGLAAVIVEIVFRGAATFKRQVIPRRPATILLGGPTSGPVLENVTVSEKRIGQRVPAILARPSHRLELAFLFLALILSRYNNCWNSSIMVAVRPLSLLLPSRK